MTANYAAEFYPQKWVNDRAVDVEPLGEQAWVCTDWVEENDGYFEDLFDQVREDVTTVVDRDDRLKADPAAPQWVRDWNGPFTIIVSRPPMQEWQVVYTPMPVRARTSEEAVAKAENGTGGGGWEATPLAETVPTMEGLTKAQRADVAHYNGFNVPVTWFIGQLRDNGSREAIALGKDFAWSLLWDEDGTLHTSEAKLGEFGTGIEI